MKIEIDPDSGFCVGVVYAIRAAEDELKENDILYCLGDIVHNNKEVERLTSKGLKIITHDELKVVNNSTVLIRAHGEPPETYRIAIENNIRLIDASCFVVLRLQNRIRIGYEKIKKKSGQVVIFGKEGHAEVNGLLGQTLETAVIINNENEINKIDFNKPILLYSQTTQSIEIFNKIVSRINQKINDLNIDDPDYFVYYNTICRQVSNRAPRLREFVSRFDAVIFVSGKKSSNGLFLFNVCKTENSNTWFVSDERELKNKMFVGCNTIGICGATSTPMWLMQDVAKKIKEISNVT